MKIEYTPKERLLAMEWGYCVDCKGKLLKCYPEDTIKRGFVLCEKCFQKKIEYARENILCYNCVKCGLRRKAQKKDFPCVGHQQEIINLFKSISKRI